MTPRCSGGRVHHQRADLGLGGRRHHPLPRAATRAGPEPARPARPRHPSETSPGDDSIWSCRMTWRSSCPNALVMLSFGTFSCRVANFPSTRPPQAQSRWFAARGDGTRSRLMARTALSPKTCPLTSSTSYLGPDFSTRSHWREPRRRRSRTRCGLRGGWPRSSTAPSSTSRRTRFGRVLTPGQSRSPRKSPASATVDVNWYCLREELDPDAARLFVATAQQLLPEALARRFGEYEPLQGKLADSGAEGFAQAWAEATSTLFVTGTGPCVRGHLSAGPSAQFSDRFWSMSLTLLAEPIGDAGWRDALRKLFVALADRLPAFYASAEVTSGHIWSGRSLWADGETEWPIRPVRYRDGWMGLPPSPVWWSWLGRPFADYFALLPDKRTRPTVNGILYQASAELAGPGELEPLSRWLPADLFAKLSPNPHRQQPVPLIRAAKSPAVLA